MFKIGDKIKFNMPNGYKGEEEVVDNSYWSEKYPIVKASKFGWVSTQFLKLVDNEKNQQM